MKDFCKMLAAVVVGNCLIPFLGFIIFIFSMVFFVSSLETDVEIKETSVLRFNIETPIVERTNALSHTALMQYFNNSVQPMSISEFCAAVEAAATDDRIKAISLEGTTANASFANLRAMREALNNFRLQSQKPVFYHGTTADQRAIYLASVADSLFVAPEGAVEMFGIAANEVFFKQLLSKLDIDVEVIRHGRYKSAGETFMRSDMSAEARKQLSQCVDTMWNVLCQDLAFARNISPETINNYVEKMDFSSAETAVETQIIDGAIYLDQYLSKLKTLVHIAANADLDIIEMSNYAMQKTATTLPSYSAAGRRIAIVYANGEIYDGSNTIDTENIYATDLAATLAKVRQRPDVKAVVLRVNSPGGSALASDIIWREVDILNQEKPVVVSMGEYAASGGYYISAPATTIFADPTTLTGSIGVFGVVPCGEKALRNIGVTFDGVQSHTEAEPSALKPLSDKQRKYYERQVEHIYNTFVQRVADGRRLLPTTVDSLAQGRVWTGLDACQNGLVDYIGSLPDAIEEAASLAKLDDYEVEEVADEMSQFQLFFKEFGASAELMMQKTPLAKYLGIAHKTQTLVEKPQMRAALEVRIEY